MEILGRSIPHLQNAIASGFETASAGIAESARLFGVAGLESAYELFSDPSIGIAGDAGIPPAVGGAAEYPDPASALGKSAVTADSGDFSAQVLRNLQDPGFRPEAEIATPGQSLNQPPESLGALSEHYWLFPPKGWDTWSPGSKLNGIIDWLWMGVEYRNARVMGKAVEDDPRSYVPPSLSAEGQAARAAELDPRSPVSEFVPGSGSVEGRANRYLAKFPGGVSGSASSADQNGMIIGDGKLDATNFQTIDDTIGQLQSDPQPEALQLLQQQFETLQAMNSTVQETAQMYGQLNSNTLFNTKLRA